MEPEPMFYRVPPEVIIKIYKSLDDIGDVKAMLGTCRRAKAIFDENEGVIAKSHLLRLLEPANLKIMIMAVASRDVDPRDEKSVEQFFRSYVWRADPWPASYVTMDMVAALPLFWESIYQLIEATWMDVWYDIFLMRMTRTEAARVVYICLMIETAANLFYRVPGKDGELLRRAPYVEWVDRYWEVFSHAEIEAALDRRNSYCEYFKGSIENVFEDHTAVELESTLGFAVGLEKLYKWTQLRSSPSPPDLMDDFWSTFRDSCWLSMKKEEVETPYHDAKRCLENKVRLQPRFRPDPDAIDEETWQRIKQMGLKEFLGYDEHRSYWFSCWDMASLTRLREAVR